ncbi:NAD(P)-dependent oxidoreductase [Ancylobacter defluvii]|uniref:Dihydrofolate reductase n=1 Tax=Ancylobacter defluvii TaxID=1282440 RepID=A0A9W6NAQ7_9HYPH|nr:NAD(P)-dependent oxidoreductase [Ancylobacter defluvii]MBS7588848.1 glyoxylate reductase (NADP(+)) [Ancylobacter defluvii]GLK83711.1 dihydrofolate reductase [Ancylobacter defluvii]
MCPVIVNQLGPEIGKRLAAHPSRPVVVDDETPAAPWEVDPRADILLTRAFPAWRAAPMETPAGWPGNLRWVQTMSAGMDAYPKWMWSGTVVSSGRGVAAVPIAEYVMAAMLAREKRIESISAHAPEDWKEIKLGRLEGATLGLIGYGAIGRAIARRAAAFDMRILAVRRGPWTEQEASVEPCTLQDMIGQADHVVVALPSTAETHHIINASVLALAKPGLHLINVGRGDLVDQQALLAALNAGRVGFATLDVTDPEPLPAGHPLYNHPRARITPHISWSDPAFLERLGSKITINLDRYQARLPLFDVIEPGRDY